MTTEDFKQRMMPFARKLYPMMKRILGSDEDTRDAMQELMIRLWNKRKELMVCQNLGAYVAVAARNFCYDVRKRKKLPSSDYSVDILIPGMNSELQQEASEKLYWVHQVIARLPEKYREVLLMREIDGLTIEEIHHLTGYEMPHIRVLLSRSRTKVREEIEKIYNYEKGTIHTA